jgi:hypothetical protein
MRSLTSEDAQPLGKAAGLYGEMKMSGLIDAQRAIEIVGRPSTLSVLSALREGRPVRRAERLLGGRHSSAGTTQALRGVRDVLRDPAAAAWQAFLLGVVPERELAQD